MYRYSEEDRQIIAAARKRNKDKRAEKRLYALELRAEGKSAEEVSAATGFHRAYITQLTAKYRAGGIEAISGKGIAAGTIPRESRKGTDSRSIRNQSQL